MNTVRLARVPVDGIFLASLALLSLRYLTGQLAFSLLGMGLLVALALHLVRSKPSLSREHQVVAALGAFTVVFAFIGADLNGYRPIYYAAVGATLIVVGYFLAERSDTVRIAQWLLYLFYAALVVLAPFKGIAPDDFNHYFPSSSRNGIGANLIFLQIFYSAAYFAKHRRAPSLTPLITFGICVLLYGRSGTIVSAGLVAVTAIQNFSLRPVRSAVSAAATAAVMSVLIFFPYLPAHLSGSEAVAFAEDTETPVAAGTTLGTQSNHNGTTETGEPDRPSISEFRRGLKTVRTQMLAEYVASLSPAEVVTGTSLMAVRVIAQYRGNPHNSFIRGHAYFGLPYLLLLAAIGLSALRSAVHQRQFFVLSLMALFAGRAFFDAFALFDIFDVGFFYCFFTLTRPRDAVAGGDNGET